MKELNGPFRVRFAPSPTGLMHLGNVRTALLNYLYARHNSGTFVLRIEDTDPSRIFDPGAKKIIETLHWLGLSYDEGPLVGGPCAPYFQSQRTALYQEAIATLISGGHVYRCFCTEAELTKKRELQKALKVPPRYDRTCTKLTPQQIEVKLQGNLPFIWRMRVPEANTLNFTDLARGNLSFDLKHFSDFPVSRSDGSFTFMFANAIDDAAMTISHVFRGEDHLTNTVGQVIIYQALNMPIPLYLHLPILCNSNGKKLSKRDFGFNIEELKESGFLPQAIVNYLAMTGGSFEQEIMSLQELIQFPFEKFISTGQIKYDVDKLRWINHKWIERISCEELLNLVRPLLTKAYPHFAALSPQQAQQLVGCVQTDLTLLTDIVEAVNFAFTAPKTTAVMLTEKQQQFFSQLAQLLPFTNNDSFLQKIKTVAKQVSCPLKEAFPLLRLALTGKQEGISLGHIIDILGTAETHTRLSRFIADTIS